MPWGIHSVYIPRENLRFMEEWLAYHTRLGAEYFHLYDNTGSTDLKLGQAIAVTGKNKYGIEMDFSRSDDEISDIEAEIFRKYPVVKTIWRPTNGRRIVHGHVAACDHFSERMKTGWCAFVDMDEFLYSPYAIEDVLGDHSIVVRQQRFADRFKHETALEITDTFPIDTRKWGSKPFIDMSRYWDGRRSCPSGSVTVHTLAGRSARSIDTGILRFNHYNHNERNHEWLLAHHLQLDENWRPVPFDSVFTEKCDLVARRASEIDYTKFVVKP